MSEYIEQEPKRRDSITVPSPMAVLRRITYRFVVLVLLVGAVLFTGASAWESHQTSERDKDAQCTYLKYGYEGSDEVKSLSVWGQEMDDLNDCGLDLPLTAEDDEYDEYESTD